MGAEDTPADVDPAEFPTEDAKTTTDGVPLPLVEERTPRPDVTGRHNTLTPAQFASAIDLTDRDAFARGVEHGRILERSEAQADAVTEHRKVREDAIDAFRALFTIFEIGHPTWDEAEAWARRRMTPL